MITHTLTHRLLSQMLAVLAVFSLLISLVPVQAFAQTVPEEIQNTVEETTASSSEPTAASFAKPPAPPNPKVDICHATKSNSNPYNLIDADETADVGGHASHHAGAPDDVTWYNGITTKWGDIIPPFVDGAINFPGKNWTPAGQAIWDNDCEAPGEGEVQYSMVKLCKIGGTGVGVKGFTLSLSGQEGTFSSVTKNKGCVEQEVPYGTYTFDEVMLSNRWVNILNDIGEAAGAQLRSTTAVVDEPTETFTLQNEECPKGEVNNGQNVCAPEQPVERVATVVATKIICTDETELPNWGKGGASITAQTATDWVANHKSCSLAEGWNFEWQPGSSASDPSDTTVGPAGGTWTTFGPTNGSGVATLNLTAADLANENTIWFREVLKSGYIPFTHEADSTNGNAVTAEFYCHTDVLNYDNREFISKPELGKTYQCVAWNVPEKPEPDPDLVEISACKYLPLAVEEPREPVAGWGMLFINAEDPESEVATAYYGTTTESGCVTQAVDPADGPWFVFERNREGWSQVDVVAEGGDVLGQTNDEFCGFFLPKKEKLNVTHDFSQANEDPEEAMSYRCDFYNQNHGDDGGGDDEPVCEIGTNLLQNASFETPIAPENGWSIFNSVPNWLVTLSDGLEIWRNFNGSGAGLASDGVQNAELDGNDATKITQTVATIPGATYELKFDFSPRAGTALVENNVDATADGSLITNVTGDGSANSANVWTTHGGTFVGTGTTTDISFEDKGAPNDPGGLGALIDNARLCLVREAPQCVPEDDVYANTVVSNNQGDRKDGSDVIPGRSDATKALADGDGFFSLGFGGSIVVAFNTYVADVTGDDLTVKETTNGIYPLEKAKIEVSQDGSTWLPLTEEARNDSADGVDSVTNLDFAETGLAWIKFVRITDTTDPAIHSNDADGYDLESVMAASVVCEVPDPDPAPVCSITMVSDSTNLVGGNPATATYEHPNWLDSLTGSLAGWIWSTPLVLNPTGTTTETFTKTFTWNGPVTAATLDIATDNSYEVKVNGVSFISDTNAVNFVTADQHDMTSFLQTNLINGTNTLEIIVTNHAFLTTDPKVNPAGLIYNLKIEGNDSVSCTTPDDGGGNNGGGGGGATVTTGGGGGGGGGGGRRGDVAGDSDSQPEGKVLGEQVSVVPLGAADAGAGGTSPLVIPGANLLTVALLNRSRK